MINFIFCIIIDIYNKDFEVAKKIYPQFGKVVEGRGYIPSVDFIKAEELYKKYDDGKNPFIPLFIGELKRMKKEPYENFYNECILRIKTLQEAVIVDLIFINGLNFKWSSLVKDKIHDIYEIKNVKADYYISQIYEKKGWEERNIGNNKTSLYLIASAIDVAPMRRELALQGFKLTLNSNRRECLGYLFRYIKSFKYINNSVYLIHNTITFFIILLLLFIISLIIYSFKNAVEYLGKLFSIKTKLKEFWITGICYSMIVFLPWKIFISIFVLLSLFFLSKRERIIVGIILLATGILCGFKIPIEKFLKNTNNLNILNSFYDPVNNRFETEKIDLYDQWLKGTALLKIEESYLAREIFKDMLKHRGYKEKILNNIGVSFYIEGKYDSALYYFLQAEKNKIPEIEYIYFNIAKTYAKLLDFPNSSKYFSMIDKLKGSKFEIYDFYPDEKSIYVFLFRSFNILNFYSVFFIFAGFIIILFSYIFKKEIVPVHCSLCKGAAVNLNKIEEIPVCEKCFEKISFSQSKSLRKRLMKLIENKGKRRERILYIIMNIFLPGSVHINKRFIFAGFIFLFIYNLILVNLLGNLVYILPVSNYSTPIHGFLVMIIILSIFYCILIISTGRIVDYGS